MTEYVVNVRCVVCALCRICQFGAISESFKSRIRLWSKMTAFSVYVCVLLVLPLIYYWPTRLGKLLIRLKPPAIQSNGKVLWNTLQPIGAHSVLVTDFWKIPFGKRYCFVNLVQQNGIAYLFGSPTHCNILSNCFLYQFT